MSLRQDRKEYWECFEKYTDKANNRMLELEAKYEKLWKLDLLRVYDIKEVKLNPKNPKLKETKEKVFYNHNFIGAAERTEKLDKAERQWEEDNQDYILNLRND